MIFNIQQELYKCELFNGFIIIEKLTYQKQIGGFKVLGGIFFFFSFPQNQSHSI